MTGKLRIDGLFKIYKIAKEHFDFDSMEDSKYFKNWVDDFILELKAEIEKPQEEYLFENFIDDWEYLTKTRIMLESKEELKEIYDKL